MKYIIILLFGVTSAQRLGSSRSGTRSGIQSLQSVPLPPAGYISPSALRQQTEPPKPFSYKYEAPDENGGYSTHESTGDETGRITGQYTVLNPDGTSRIVKYVADPETGFHAEVQTDEEGTKTSAPSNVIIESTAPEEDYQRPQRNRNAAKVPNRQNQRRLSTLPRPSGQSPSFGRTQRQNYFSGGTNRQVYQERRNQGRFAARPSGQYVRARQSTQYVAPKASRQYIGTRQLGQYNAGRPSGQYASTRSSGQLSTFARAPSPAYSYTPRQTYTPRRFSQTPIGSRQPISRNNFSPVRAPYQHGSAAQNRF